MSTPAILNIFRSTAQTSPRVIQRFIILPYKKRFSDKVNLHVVRHEIMLFGRLLRFANSRCHSCFNSQYFDELSTIFLNKYRGWLFSLAWSVISTVLHSHTPAAGMLYWSLRYRAHGTGMSPRLGCSSNHSDSLNKKDASLETGSNLPTPASPLAP